MSLNVLFLGMTKNYPFEFNAGNSKTELIGKGLAATGNRVLVLGDIIGQQLPPQMPLASLPYLIFSPAPSRYIAWFLNLFRIARELKRSKCSSSRNILIVGADFYPFFVMYVLLGRLFGYRIAVIYHEWHSFQRKAKLLRLWSGYLFDYSFGYIVHAILPISHFLLDHSRRFHKPMFIVPILAEYDSVLPLGVGIPEAPLHQFIYCVHAGYLRVIKTILDAFRFFLMKNPGFRLILVVTGRADMIEDVRHTVANAGLAENVDIYSQVPFDYLHRLYRDATALLIPLDPDSPQDQARFSQKIAEYLTSRRPVITTAVGEISYYFNDRVNAIIAKQHSAIDYADAMDFCVANPALATQIGERGYELGAAHFDCRTEGIRLTEFLHTV